MKMFVGLIVVAMSPSAVHIPVKKLEALQYSDVVVKVLSVQV